MSEFYIYDNSQANYSKIHRAICPHCNHGTGTSGEKVGPADQFIACDTLDEARRRTTALGRADQSVCEHCRPDEV